MESRSKNTVAWLTIVLAVQCISAQQNQSLTEINENLAAIRSNNDSTPAMPAVGDIAKSSPMTTSLPDNKTVQIAVYYEALCADSVKFVATELLPVYNTLSKFINVTFIPFAQGNITENGEKNATLICKRASECDADEVHACGINKITDSDKLIKFVNCSLTEGFNNITKTVPIDVCGKNSNIETNVINEITDCAKNKGSYKLLKHYMDMSINAKVQSVPKVFINQIATENLTSTNLMRIVCSHIPEKDSLADCKIIVNGSDTLVVGVLPIIIGAFYIIKMI